MITQLSIQGLAIIDSLQIDFAPGFNVITGETGAGKSILIRALNLLTGAKASADVVRSGRDSAVVTGEFQISSSHRAVEALESLGIGIEEQEPLRLLLRRQLHAKGKSQAWINDVPVALSSLRSVGGLLLDVFAQHENQRLLNPGEHVDYVDSFHESSIRESVRSLGKRSVEGLHALVEIVESLQNSSKQIDYLNFRHEELQAFDPSAEDFEQISSYCRQAESFQKVRDPLAEAARLLEGREEGASPSEMAKEVSKLLLQAERADDKIRTLQERAAACAAELEDLGFEMTKILSNLEFDEARLEKCQNRLFGYQSLIRKHGVSGVDGLLVQASTLQNQLSILSNASESLEKELDKALDLGGELKRQCSKLSVSRLQAADSIKEAVERELSDLHMPGSVFQVEFTPVRRELPKLALDVFGPKVGEKWAKISKLLESASESGAEKAQFFLSANPGEPPMPLSKVASGGELSRIMLALKRALAADAQTCVLVFDEIDSGISGRVADVVGRKMRELCENFQVLCISHLPQVAVYADHHLLVAKKGKGERTESTILALTKEESAREIARLLSGREVSSTSLANAKNLIAAARLRAKPSSLQARV